MKGTGSLIDQLDKLVGEVISLRDRLARTAENVRFAQSSHPQGVVAELAESRKIMLDLSARLAEVEIFLSSSGETASEPLGQIPPAMSPHDIVSLRPASPEDSIAEVPSASRGRKWEEADARLSGLTQLIETVLRAESASDAAMNLGDLALQYHRQKKFDEAERLYQHALAFREKFFGPDHASVATCLNNLAVLLQEQGRFDEAAALLRRSLSIKEKAWGPDHPKLARCLSNLASLALKQENFTEAKYLFERVHAIGEKHKQTTLPGMKASSKKYPAAPEGKVTVQECKEEAEVDVNPGRQGSEQLPLEAKVSNHPTPPASVREHGQRRKPAMPVWAWIVAAVVVLSICSLFVWKLTGRPVQIEIRKSASTNLSSSLTPTPTTGTLKFPDLLPGTRVRVDGVPHNLAADGSFEATLSEGYHNVQLTRPGYEPKSLSVELKAGQIVTIMGREVTVDSPITGK